MQYSYETKALRAKDAHSCIENKAAKAAALGAAGKAVLSESLSARVCKAHFSCIKTQFTGTIMTFFDEKPYSMTFFNENPVLTIYHVKVYNIKSFIRFNSV